MEEKTVTIPENLHDLCSSSNSIEAENVNNNNNNINSKKDEKDSWVINVKCEEDEAFEGEKVCRICHLGGDQPLKSVSPRAKIGLIELGCSCKGELSVAHLHCGEAWFKLKGNRTCEICGQTVNNIRGVSNEGFMEEWKESRSNGDAPDSSQTTDEQGPWHGQPLCNFLMACLVIAFIVPWFFRINLW